MLGMNTLNRRELCVALSALSTLAALGEPAAGAQTPAPALEVLSTQKSWTFDAIPAQKSANGGFYRPVTKGVLPTGEEVELHETTLPPGQMPHPAHKHRHSEFMMIRVGTLEFDNDGTKQVIGPGGVVFAASNVMHGLKNIGDVPAEYFVIAIGHE